MWCTPHGPRLNVPTRRPQRARAAQMVRRGRRYHAPFQHMPTFSVTVCGRFDNSGLWRTTRRHLTCSKGPPGPNFVSLSRNAKTAKEKTKSKSGRRGRRRSGFHVDSAAWRSRAPSRSSSAPPLSSCCVLHTVPWGVSCVRLCKCSRLLCGRRSGVPLGALHAPVRTLAHMRTHTCIYAYMHE